MDCWIITLQGTNISPQKWHFEDDFPFPKVGYVNPLEGTIFCIGYYNWYTSSIGWTFLAGRCVAFDDPLMLRTIRLGYPKGILRWKTGGDAFVNVPATPHENEGIGPLKREHFLKGTYIDSKHQFSVDIYTSLRIMGSQNWWFGDPRPLLYTSKPLNSRVQWFLGVYIFVSFQGCKFVQYLIRLGSFGRKGRECWNAYRAGLVWFCYSLCVFCKTLSRKLA